MKQAMIAKEGEQFKASSVLLKEALKMVLENISPLLLLISVVTPAEIKSLV